MSTPPLVDRCRGYGSLRDRIRTRRLCENSSSETTFFLPSCGGVAFSKIGSVQPHEVQHDGHLAGKRDTRLLNPAPGKFDSPAAQRLRPSLRARSGGRFSGVGGWRAKGAKFPCFASLTAGAETGHHAVWRHFRHEMWSEKVCRNPTGTGRRLALTLLRN